MSEGVEMKASEEMGEVPQKRIVELTKGESCGKLIDELTSIEREIAIMHDGEDEDDDDLHAGESGLPMDVLSLDEAGNKLPYDLHADLENDAQEQVISSSKQFERRNGTSALTELSDAPDSTESLATNKVLENQLEHDDLLAVLKGTDVKEDDCTETGVTIEGEGEFQIVDIIDNDVDCMETDPLAKEGPKHGPLTKEEERKVALEQWQSLEQPKSRRRKQDIKAIVQPADLLTSLVSDWSDGDEPNPGDESEGAPVPAQKKKVVTSTSQGKTSSLQQKKVQEDSSLGTVKEKEKSEVETLATKQPENQSKKVINTTAPQEKKTPIVPPPSPFKRTRIIKRRIIWDPDAPETQFSYAKLVKPSAPNPTKKEVKKDVKKDRTTPTPLKKKEEPPTTPTTTTAATTGKRQNSETQATVNGNKKKKFSEIDRLLGDEGAVNMLNSLESERTKRTPESDSVRAAANRKAGSTSSNSPTERAQTPQKKEVAQPKRRTPKPKASSSWDYVYKRQNDDSMIIRRRSNSSYSSSASINRLSMDGPSSAGKTPKTTPKSSPKTPNVSSQGSTPISADKSQEMGKQFEFAKPENKNKAKKMRSPIVIVNPLSADMKRAAIKRVTKSPVSENSGNDDDELQDVVIVKIGNLRQVTFNTSRAKLSNTFTVQLMNELTRVLEDLNDDSDCNAVLLLSESQNFCQGIDFTDLALGTIEKRKNAAILMGKAVKHFLSTLVKFQKPLIAGVNGVNSGIGVTMLPLFDVVIGSDKGTYETPYAKIGQIPEAYYIFSETPKVRSTFKTKLLWLSEKLHSTESALSGLVNKLTSASKVNEEALACAKKIASLSIETYTVMKKRSIEQTLAQIITSLEDEEEILIRQWCSAPCVDNFKHFIHKGQW